MPQTTHQASIPRQEPDIATSCARGMTSQCSSGVEEERDKTSRCSHKMVRSEGNFATPALHDHIQNTPGRGHPGEAISPVSLPGPRYPGEWNCFLGPWETLGHWKSEIGNGTAAQRQQVRRGSKCAETASTQREHQRIPGCDAFRFCVPVFRNQQKEQ